MSIRLYVRSIHRTIIKQLTIFSGIKNLLKDIFQITNKKEKISQTISLSKARLERKREIINSETPDQQNMKIINLTR